MQQVIVPMQYAGLGDIIYQQTLVHTLAGKGGSILWPVEEQFVDGLNRAYPNVRFVDKRLVHVNYGSKREVRVDNIRILPLRWADVILKMAPDDCMKAKYKLYDLDWNIWKQEAQWVRDYRKENELFEMLGLTIGDEYVFVNHTFRSAFQDSVAISIDSKLKIIEMKFYPGFSLFDWTKVIEYATEIHTVSTALFYMLEILNLQKPVHLYPRPNDPNFEHIKYLFSKPYILHYTFS